MASANAFDTKVNTAAAQISPNYVDLVTLAARQTFASVELTVPTGSDGKLNSSDTLLFIGPDRCVFTTQLTRPSHLNNI